MMSFKSTGKPGSFLVCSVLCAWFWGVLAGATILFSCDSKSGKKIVENNKTQERQVLRKPPATYQDTMFIENMSAVFFQPDSLQLENFKALNSEMIWRTTVHESENLFRNARLVLQRNWPNVEIKDAVNRRILAFKKKDGKKVYMDLDKLDVYGLILFEPQKDPEQADMMNIDTDLGFYFSGK